MIEKSLSVPAFRRRSVRRRLSLFSEENTAILSYGLHFRESERGLCCAEGATERMTLAEGERFLFSEGHDSTLFLYGEGVLRSEGREYPVPSAPKQLLSYRATDGTLQYFALCGADCYLLAPSAPAQRVLDGGTCGCLYDERLFFANGSQLHWTKPLEPTAGEEALRGAGHVELPSSAGDILALTVLKDTLYAFRERGITRLYAPGDELSFRAEEVPYAGGAISAGTVRSCGEAVLFLAEGRLFSLNGTDCRHLTGCGEDFVDTDGCVTASCGGSYYATVRHAGERCIWCVRPSVRRGHLIRMRAEQLAGGRELLFSEGGKLYALTARGLPAMRRRECVLRTEHSLLGLSSRRKYLDGVTVEGTGSFRVEARGEHGLSRAVCGRAGEELRFPVPVRGVGFSLDIRSIEPGACLRSLVFDLREEVPTW